MKTILYGHLTERSAHYKTAGGEAAVLLERFWFGASAVEPKPKITFKQSTDLLTGG